MNERTKLLHSELRRRFEVSNVRIRKLERIERFKMEIFIMATKSFQEIARETEQIIGNIGLFMVEEQCRKIGKCPDSLEPGDEPLLIMEILTVASTVTSPNNWKKLVRIFKRRISGIK